MVIRVLYFGMLREMFRADGCEMELESGATIRDAVQRLRGECSAAAEVFQSLAYAVNRQYEPADTVLQDGDELAMLPPVSGGADGADGAGSDHIAIVREPIVTAELVAGLASPRDGATVVFEGIVRNHSRGRETLFLDYEAYEEMALAQMHSLAAKARETFAVQRIVMVHRLGRLRVGEVSVMIAVASAHRAAAYDASRWLIDTLKQTVPIWKKEHFADGAVWADGEVFPEALVR